MVHVISVQNCNEVDFYIYYEKEYKNILGYYITIKMGIPSYFSYIIKNYSNIIRNLSFFKKQTNFTFQHLYMDCNSIIYDAVHTLEKQINGGTPIETDFETAVIKKVSRGIEDYIKLIQPTDCVFITFDGVAPFAKMEQQRTRRYKSSFMANISFDTVCTKKPAWNTSAITPGTDFMEKLSKQIDYDFKHNERRYNVKQIMVSGANCPGEGEHKLFANLRQDRFLNDNVAVYGLDADLIMLSIFHLKYCKNIYVFREAPEFLKNSIPIQSRGNDNEPHFLDIKQLTAHISSEMNCKFADPLRIYDYVFMCFFLGNDFLPHFPAMNIRTHGITALLDIYRMYIGNHADRFFISKTTGNIQWKNVAIFVKEIAKREHEFLQNEYHVRDKFDKRQYPDTTPAEKEEFMQNIPTIYRAEEKYICPTEPYWEDRYYKALMGCKRNMDDLRPICNNYLEGLEWVFKYYTRGCPDWRWKYDYHYPPLFTDVYAYIPHFEMDFIDESKATDTRPFSPEVQLSYVLSYSNLHLLPAPIYQFLKTNYPELYPENYKFQWAFCRYFWEAHPILPEIPLSLLEQWELQYKLCKK
jgi:5'-3' exoribonuclease 1